MSPADEVLVLQLVASPSNIPCWSNIPDS